MSRQKYKLETQTYNFEFQNKYKTYVMFLFLWETPKIELIKTIQCQNWTMFCNNFKTFTVRGKKSNNKLKCNNYRIYNRR